jgi:electron transport complex protein RnfE
MNKQSLARGLLLVPLVGASNSWVNALSLWAAWTLISGGHGLAMGLLRPHLDARQRLLTSIVLAATLTACASLAAQAWWLEWYRPLNLYVGWIALSCVAQEHDRSFIEPRLPGYLTLTGLFGLLMLGMGALRELIGKGTPLALIAPGGFLLLGLLLAAYQAWMLAQTQSPLEETPRP